MVDVGAASVSLVLKSHGLRPQERDTRAHMLLLRQQRLRFAEFRAVGIRSGTNLY
jgi:hypothetical protein